MRLNKNGFTLIEVMAVLIILGIVGLIVFPSAMESNQSSKEKLYREQVDRILDATDSWAAANDDRLPAETVNSTPTIITVEDLQKAGLLKVDDVKNPLDSEKKMDGNILIYYSIGYNQYLSLYCDNDYGQLYYDEDGKFANMQVRCQNKLLGDLNEDGIINNKDITLLTNLSNNSGDTSTATSPYSGDLDGDGKLTEYDVTLLRELLAS